MSSLSFNRSTRYRQSGRFSGHRHPPARRTNNLTISSSSSSSLPPKTSTSPLDHCSTVEVMSAITTTTMDQLIKQQLHYTIQDGEDFLYNFEVDAIAPSRRSTLVHKADHLINRLEQICTQQLLSTEDRDRIRLLRFKLERRANNLCQLIDGRPGEVLVESDDDEDEDEDEEEVDEEVDEYVDDDDDQHHNAINKNHNKLCKDHNR